MKKFALGIFLIGCAFAFSYHIAEAHVLVTDNNIGAVLHIDPDDDPIAGQQSGFFFEFKDKTNKFNPRNCDCQFSITQSGKIIYSQPLFQNADNTNSMDATVFFTFPQKDVYELAVTGKPNTSGAFQPFKLIYDIRVDRIKDASGISRNTTNRLLGTYMWAAVFLITVIVSIFMVYKHNSKRKKEIVRKK